MAIKDWKIEQLTGYKPRANLYVEFSISEPFGISAIANTYNRLCAEYKNNAVYLTELSMVINWKIYEHYDKEPQFAKFYQSIWEQIDNNCKENLKGEELRYYETHIADYCSW